VNAVSPGPIFTPLYGKLDLAKEAVNGFAASIVSQVPLKCFGKTGRSGTNSLVRGPQRVFVHHRR
jgi:hypothetical protein